MYYYNLFAGEKYYFCLLLISVTGPKSFEDLKTIDNHLYPTFCAICVSLDLLEDDGKWVSYFTKAFLFSNKKTLCTLMVLVLTYGSISDLSILWKQLQKKICDDLPHWLQAFIDIPADFKNLHYDYGLYLIN